ncbi:CLUMA_CG010420, isoform A [Clunio marinus]|uniref:CLUMA_CG010420, isoform A n=1 Tax=Clunio marinus TaxID=568069 RepID=A0A1J1IBR0_9DIPT|nr:CLUMA_CG010420, isoform A [Clunio marinus]
MRKNEQNSQPFETKRKELKRKRTYEAKSYMFHLISSIIICRLGDSIVLEYSTLWAFCGKPDI